MLLVDAVVDDADLDPTAAVTDRESEPRRCPYSGPTIRCREAVVAHARVDANDPREGRHGRDTIGREPEREAVEHEPVAPPDLGVRRG